MHNKRIVFFIVILVLIFLTGFVFAASPKKPGPQQTSTPAPSTIPSKPPSKVTLTKIKYSGPKPSMTVYAIKYSGPKPNITVYAIKYTGKTLQSSIQKVSKSFAKKQTKSSNIRPTLLSSSRQVYNVGSRIPLRVSMATKTKGNLIFEFVQNYKKQWRKIGHQQLGRPEINQNIKTVVVTRHVKLMQPGQYRWRCSANKGKSWSAWSKTFKVVGPGVKKPPKLRIGEQPERKNTINSRED